MEADSNKITLYSISIIFALGVVNGFYKEPLFNISKYAFWAQDFIHFVLLPIVILLYLYKRCNLHPKQYGLIKPGKLYPLPELVGASLFTAFILYITYISVYGVSLKVATSYGYIKPYFSYHSVIPEGILNLPVVIYLALTAAVVEEIIFRGIPYKLIFENKQIRNKKSVYILITSFLFAVIHWESGYPNAISAFVFGLLAAWLYHVYKNLWPLIGGIF